MTDSAADHGIRTCPRCGGSGEVLRRLPMWETKGPAWTQRWEAGESMADIARSVGLTRERVRQVISQFVEAKFGESMADRKITREKNLPQVDTAGLQQRLVESRYSFRLLAGVTGFDAGYLCRVAGGQRVPSRGAALRIASVLDSLERLGYTEVGEVAASKEGAQRVAQDETIWERLASPDTSERLTREEAKRRLDVDLAERVAEVAS
jgi:hypothetical protein